MRTLYKISLSMAALVLLALATVCGWLFFYTGDLPDTKHLFQFAPSAQFTVLDSCLASPSMAIPFDRIGKTMQDALAAAESPTSFPHQIARSLMCNHTGGMGRYHVNSLRLSWHIRWRFSEQQVFAIYANRAYFGSGVTGVENASRQFFRKDSDALNTQEAALLAGLLRAPDSSPYKHPEKALQRRNQVLESYGGSGEAQRKRCSTGGSDTSHHSVG
jgi:membrane carboxypeptidase/penicillin-binding protein